MCKKLNILFTCAGRRVALLDEFRRAMSDLGIQGTVLAADITGATAAMKMADRSFILPKADDSDYVEAVSKLVSSHSIGLIIPVTDMDLYPLAVNRGALRNIGCEVMVCDPGVIDICKDKIRFMDFLDAASIPSLRTMTPDQFEKNPFYPCFVKPVHGSAGTGAMKIENRARLDHHLHLFEQEMLVQEYIPGSEYTIDLFCDSKGLVKSVVPRVRLEIRCGEVDKSVTVDDNDLVVAATQLATSFDAGVRGMMCFQCRRSSSGEIYFFDANPRFGGGSLLSIAAGADFPRYILEDVLGMESSAVPGQFVPNLLMMRYSRHICCEVDNPSSLPGAGGPIVK